MGNSLSQFISDVRKSRNEELGQMLSSALPFMQYEIERERTRKQYDEQLGRYKTDLGMQITESDLRDEFLNSPYETMEGAQYGFASAIEKQKYRGYSRSLRNSYSTILGENSLSSLDQAILTSTNREELDGQLKGILSTAEAGANIINPKAQEILNPEYYAKYQQYVQEGSPAASALVQAQQEMNKALQLDMNRSTAEQNLSLNRQYGVSRGGSGGIQTSPEATTMKVTDNYRTKRDKVIKVTDSGSYVATHYNGELVLLPAEIGNDERLYLVGERGKYPANPHQFQDYPKGKAALRAISKADIDRWNSPGGQNNTEGADEVIGIDINGNPIMGVK